MAESQTERAITALKASNRRLLEIAIRDAIKISESRIGVDHTGRQNIALFIFAKLIAHCMSMDMILSNCNRVLATGAYSTISL